MLVGHCLGAGVTAILAVLLHQDYPALHCYAYSPPGCLMRYWRSTVQLSQFTHLNTVRFDGYEPELVVFSFLFFPCCERNYLCSARHHFELILVSTREAFLCITGHKCKVFMLAVIFIIFLRYTSNRPETEQQLVLKCTETVSWTLGYTGMLTRPQSTRSRPRPEHSRPRPRPKANPQGQGQGLDVQGQGQGIVTTTAY